MTMSIQSTHTSPYRIARAAILNGLPIPPATAAHLEAIGTNVGELERRLRQQMEHRL